MPTLKSGMQILNSKDGKECVKKFDTILPDYAGKVSDVKKIDFMLVSKR